MKKNGGLTLIELLMTLVINVWIICSVFYVYLYSEKIYQTQQKLIHLIENKKIIYHLLVDDIHNRGAIALQDYYLAKNHVLYKKIKDHENVAIIDSIENYQYSIKEGYFYVEISKRYGINCRFNCIGNLNVNGAGDVGRKLEGNASSSLRAQRSNLGFLARLY